MPSTDSTVSSATPRIVRRYHRVERAVSTLFALAVATVAAVAFLSVSVLPALAITLATVAVVRVPVFETGGRVTLDTDATPDAVLADFAGPRPPVLAFQWGPADGVRETDDGAVYDFSYLFGLRSLSMSVTTEPLADDGQTLELSVSTAGQPWGRYLVRVSETDDGTVVDVEYSAERLFDLRSLPQWILARRYRDAVLDAQGYTVRGRESTVTVGRNG